MSDDFDKWTPVSERWTPKLDELKPDESFGLDGLETLTTLDRIRVAKNINSVFEVKPLEECGEDVDAYYRNSRKEKFLKICGQIGIGDEVKEIIDELEIINEKDKLELNDPPPKQSQYDKSQKEIYKNIFKNKLSCFDLIEEKNSEIEKLKKDLELLREKEKQPQQKKAEEEIKFAKTPSERLYEDFTKKLSEISAGCVSYGAKKLIEDMKVRILEKMNENEKKQNS